MIYTYRLYEWFALLTKISKTKSTIDCLKKCVMDRRPSKKIYDINYPKDLCHN